MHGLGMECISAASAVTSPSPREGEHGQREEVLGRQTDRQTLTHSGPPAENTGGTWYDGVDSKVGFAGKRKGIGQGHTCSADYVTSTSLEKMPLVDHMDGRARKAPLLKDARYFGCEAHRNMTRC